MGGDGRAWGLIPSAPSRGAREVLGRARLFHPFAECSDVVVGRAGARSASFAPDAEVAAAGPAVLVGAAAGSDAADVATRAEAELLERVSNVLAGRRPSERRPSTPRSTS